MPIRRLFAHERPLFAAHLKRLSTDDRRFRFATTSVTDARIDSYVAGIAETDIVLGWLDGEILTGAVHVALDGAVAEIGVSVDAEQRGRGIGADLFHRAIRWARNRGAGRLYTLCLTDNLAMTALARKAGMTVHRESGTAEAFLPLDPPDLVTVSDELGAGVETALHDWAGLLESCRELWMGTVRLP